MKKRTVKIIKTLRKPFDEFIELEQSSGIILIGATVVSLLLANSRFGSDFLGFWEQHLSVSIENIVLDKSLLHWLNDGIMAIFFLLVGLEIKRELLEGELSTLRQALLPVFAAVGGMVIPAVLYALLNFNTDTSSGWGIPMATDIAFALAVLTLLSDKIPAAIKIFLTALAIIDDLGAVIVIAIFYTSNLSVPYLLRALLVLIILATLNRLKVKKLLIYIILGIVMWYFTYKSGVHATIAGVLLAFTLPYKTTLPKNKLLQLLQEKYNNIRQHFQSPDVTSRMITEEVEDFVDHTSSVSQQLEHSLHGYVLYLIMPVFALANTGLIISNELFESVFTPSSLGIMLGLLIGKPLGISLFSYIAVKTNLAALPEEVSWKHILGVSFLGGIGFTMSIFITLLAFEDIVLQDISKLAILIASVMAALIGFVILKRSEVSG